MVPMHWRKLARDMSAESGRLALMIAALTVSLSVLGAVFGGYAILSREIRSSYLGSRPAAATLTLDGPVTPEVLAGARRQAGIAEAAGGEIVTARVKVGDDWRPLLLFVAEDFEDLRLNVFRAESGAWPPPPGTMLVERTARDVIQAGPGATVWVKPPRGPARAVKVSGVVHDQGLAPAWQEEEGYGYITPATLAWLGETPVVHELRFTLTDRPFERGAIEQKVNEMAAWLKGEGLGIREARVPPPGRHPHQTQMFGVLFLLFSFAVLTVVLGAVVVGNGVAAMLARQVREIGIMKTLGARSVQIFGLYGAQIVGLGAVAVAMALPLGGWGARRLAGMSGGMLNLAMADRHLPPWVYATVLGAGLVLPGLVTSLTLRRAARLTPRQAMDQHGAALPGGQPSRAGAWLSRRGGRLLMLAVRNALRRRGRFLGTVALLAVGGALFMSAHNLMRGWQGVVERVFETRSYDVEIQLAGGGGDVARISELAGVRRVESWGWASAAVARDGQAEIARTYPDGSHGSLTLAAPPPATELVHFPLLAGRWLREDDVDAVVLSHMVKAQVPNVGVGDVLDLSVAGRPTRWRVVGLVEEVGAAGMAYVTPRAFARAIPDASEHATLRLATDASSPEERTAIIRRVEDALQAQGTHVKAVIPLGLLRTAMGDHVLVLARLLLAMAALMAVVGALGLGSTMSTAVIERTRELGVLKAIGARPGQIARLVVTEALFAAAVSWGAAGLLAVPLTWWIGRTVGLLSFRVRLPLRWDAPAMALWLGLVAAISVLATWLPARRASRLTVREALAEV